MGESGEYPGKAGLIFGFGIRISDWVLDAAGDLCIHAALAGSVCFKDSQRA